MDLTFLDDLSKKFKKKNPIFLTISQGKRGLETYINEDIFKIMKPYKKQISEFLRSVIEGLNQNGEI